MPMARSSIAFPCFIIPKRLESSSAEERGRFFDEVYRKQVQRLDRSVVTQKRKSEVEVMPEEDVIILSSDSESELEDPTGKTEHSSNGSVEEEEIEIVFDSGGRLKGQQFPQTLATATSAAGSVVDWDDDVIILEDESEDNITGWGKTSHQLVNCSSCCSTKDDPFNTRRRQFGNIFSCPVCKDSFTKLNQCVAHEIAVHGLNYDGDSSCVAIDDRLVAQAKEIWRLKTSLKTLTAAASEPSNVMEGRTLGTSTTFLPYCGPPLRNSVEAYKIQLYHSSRKSHANSNARDSLNAHRKNVSEGRVEESHLRRFSNLKQKMARSQNPLKRIGVAPEIPTKKFLSDKRPVENDSKSDKDVSAVLVASPFHSPGTRPLARSSSRSPTTEQSASPGEKEPRKGLSPSEGSSSVTDESPSVTSSIRRYHKRKGRLSEVDLSSQKGTEKRRVTRAMSKFKRIFHLTVPIPDATFTEKERFLYALGLHNKFRLHILQKKPLESLQLPECIVKLEKPKKNRKD